MISRSLTAGLSQVRAIVSSADASASIPSSMSASLESSAGEWLDAAVQAADEEHPGRDAGRREDRRVVAGAGDELGRAGRGRAQRRERRAAHRDRLGAAASARSRSRRRARRARRRSRRARRPRRSTRAGTTFAAPGSTSSRPTVATVPGPAASRDAQDERGRLDERVVARVHRRRARRGRRGPRRRPRRCACPTIAVTIPSGASGALEHRALLDVQLEEGVAAAGRPRRTRGCRRSRAPRRGRRRPRAARRSGVAASSAATTPSAPSNRPPFGTESRCEPLQTAPARRAGRTCSPPRRPRPRARPPRASAATSAVRGILLGRAADPRRADRVELASSALQHAGHAAPSRSLRRAQAYAAVTPVPERRRSSSTARRPMSP